MKLRTRVAIAAAGAAAVTALTALVSLDAQRDHLDARLDDRIDRLIPIARLAHNRWVADRRNPRGLELAMSEAWVGHFDARGDIQTIATPTDNSSVSPVLTGTPRPGTRGDVPSSDRTGEWRIRGVGVADGGVLVVALPTDADDDLLTLLVRLNVAQFIGVLLIVGLIAWWVVTLGVRPIVRLTREARTITQGNGPRRLLPDSRSSEAADLAESLNEMIGAVEESEQRVRRFMNDASHELRTPLTTLRGYTSLYLDGTMRDERGIADAMRRMNAEAIRMARIIDDLLAEERVTGTSLKPERFDLVDLVADCLGDLRAHEPDRMILLWESEPVMVTADSDLVTQAVTNLVRNALDHTAANVEVHVTSGPDSARIEVSDNGPGIPAEHLPHLFERLYRADSGRHGGGAHSGLGLAIVAAIAGAHGGDCGVDSSIGVGSRFWISLPLGV